MDSLTPLIVHGGSSHTQDRNEGRVMPLRTRYRERRQVYDPRGGPLDDPDLRTHSSVSHGHRHLTSRGHEPDPGPALLGATARGEVRHPVIANFGIVWGNGAGPCHRLLQHGLDLRALRGALLALAFSSPCCSCRAARGAPVHAGRRRRPARHPVLMLLSSCTTACPPCTSAVELDVRALALIVYNTPTSQRFCAAPSPTCSRA